MASEGASFRDILAHHLQGTRFGIHVDPADGLLHQGQEGYQLTWMDAKVGDWVVTPRRGKAVEINGLWYNALRLLENWLREEGDEAAAKEAAGHADKARASFNRRFWNPQTGYLFDHSGLTAGTTYEVIVEVTNKSGLFKDAVATVTIQ